jgi:Dihydrodipicolinate reductase, N-terminus
LTDNDLYRKVSMTIKVFKVATGNVGSEMIKRIADQPDLELIGVHCYSPDKIGKDAGELAGIAPIGVTATGTVEDIIAAKPDVLTFHGVFPDEDLYVKVLEAGSTSSPPPTGSPAFTATPTTPTTPASRSRSCYRKLARRAVPRSTAPG